MTRNEAEAWFDMDPRDQTQLLRSMNEAERWVVLGLLVNALAEEVEELEEELFPLAA